MYTAHTDDRLDKPFRARAEHKDPPRIAASPLMAIIALSIALLSAGVGVHVFWVVPALMLFYHFLPVAWAVPVPATEPSSADD
jgi:hypothetical protein